VGQEVPFVTGSFTNTGGAGAVNPFQTIDREQIGVKLSITPQINEGNSMVLEISQEISSIAQSAGAAVDLITNQRIVETTVIVDDGEILVLGGLIEDTLLESHQAVPVLGRIPFLGALFRSQKTEKRKTNLMIFIRAEIMRDSTETAFQTNSKYNMIREVQRGRENDDIQLMPGRSPPILPKLEDIQNDGSE
jgi:general secretion pathway protein D